MNQPEDDHSLENEPQRHHRSHPPDPSEATAYQRLRRQSVSLEDHVEHSVWDEPGLSKQLTGEPEPDALTYANWLEYRIAVTSVFQTWLITILVSLSAGPFAILGALFRGGETMVQVIAVTVIGPLAEEVFKVAAALWVVEKRPYLFFSPFQIIFCAVAGGFVFAAIENFMYLKVYIPDPSPELIAWRWSVCVALHMGCSCIAGLGLAKVWKETVLRRTKPHLGLATPMICTAIVIHGLYNALAFFLSI